MSARARAVAAGVVLAIGVLLMAGKIHADSEPGAIPLLLVLAGLVGVVFAWRRAR